MKALTLLLVVALFWAGLPDCRAQARPAARLTAEQLARLYPNAVLRQVSPEDYARIRKQFAGRAVIVVDEPVSADDSDPVVGDTNAVEVLVVTTNAPASAPGIPAAVPPSVQGDARSHRAGAASPAGVDDSDDSCVALFDLFSDVDLGDTRELAVVVFVVVGVVVVAALVVYGGVYLVNMATGSGDYDYWYEVQSRAGWLAGSGDSGGLYGARLAVGFEDGGVQVGLGAEVGHLNVKAELESDAPPVELEGVYWLVGPVLRWPFGGGASTSDAFAELLGGSTEDDESRFLSVARAGVNLGLGERISLGVSIGSLYTDLKASEGPAREGDNFALLLGAGLGVGF